MNKHQRYVLDSLLHDLSIVPLLWVESGSMEALGHFLNGLKALGATETDFNNLAAKSNYWIDRATSSDD